MINLYLERDYQSRTVLLRLSKHLLVGGGRIFNGSRWNRIRVRYPIKPEHEEHDPGEGSSTLHNDDPPPPYNVRVILLMLLHAIRDRAHRANPTNKVIEQQDGGYRHHPHRNQRHKSHAQQHLLPRR